MTENKARHTELPWRIDVHEDTNAIVIRSTIVEGVDAYEDIVAILEHPDILVSMDDFRHEEENEIVERRNL